MQSEAKKYLESRMLGNLHVRFGVGVRAQIPGLHHIGYKYDQYHDSREDDDYVAFTHQWVDAAIRATKKTGSLFLMIGDEYAAEMRMHLKHHEKKGSIFFRNWIIWHYTFGQNCKAKFNRSHVSIFYVTRDEKNFTFNADAIRVPSARQTTYGDKRAQSTGKLPDDTWVLRPQESNIHYMAPDDTWYLSRLCGTFKERVDWHPCQIPQALLHRIITVASNKNDLILDPFSGSGTTALAAKQLGRKYLGVELSPEYARKSQERVDAVKFDSVEPTKIERPIKTRRRIEPKPPTSLF